MKSLKRIENIKKIYRVTYLMIALYTGLHSLSDIAVKYLYKDELEVSPDVLSLMRSVEKVPFIFQPLTAFFIDVYYIFGYRRQIYIFIATYINIICLLLISFTRSTILSLGLLVFSIKIGISLCFTVSDALTVELKNLEEFEKFEKAQDIVSNYFLFKFSGEFITGFLKWYLVEIVSLQTIFLISSILTLILVIAGVIFNEKRINKEIELITNEYNSEELKILINDPIDQITNDKSYSNIMSPPDKIDDEKDNFDLNFSQNKQKNTTNTSNKSHNLKKIYHVLSSKNYLIPMMFLLFFKTSPPLDEPMFYFYTNHLQLTPKELGYVELFSTVMFICAVLSYKYYLKKFSAIMIFTCSILLNFLVGGIFLILSLRINLKYGIPDLLLVFICGPFKCFFLKLILMPLLSAGCALSPKDLEGTVVTCFYAALNLGSCIGEWFSSIVSRVFNLGHSNFDNLHWVIITCKLYSLIPVVVIFFIDPEYFNPKDSFINEENNTDYSEKSDDLKNLESSQ